MDTSKDLVVSILKGGPAAYRLSTEKVQASFLYGDGRVAFEYLVDYFKAYNELPSLELVQGKTGIPLDFFTPQGTIEFCIDEVVKSHLQREVKNLTLGSAKLLEDYQPREALAFLQDGAKKIHAQQLTGSKIVTLGSQGAAVMARYNLIKSGARGIMSPWDLMNDVTLGLWPQDLALFVARVGIGKCLSAYTNIIDPETGVPSTIEELFQDPSRGYVSSWSREEGVHIRPITAKHDTGTKRCLKVTFGSGRSVEVTPEHPFLTPEGWRRADEVSVGWTLGLPARMPHPRSPVRVADHVVDFLALMLADGTCNAKTPIFSKRAPSIVQIGERIAANLGVELKSYDTGNDWGFSQGRGVHTINPAKQLLIEHGLDGKLSKDKTIPEAVYRLPADQLARFLSVFFMCDGYMESGVPGVTLASEKLVREIQSLLLRFGIQSSVNYKAAKNQDGVFDAWRLRVYSRCVETFASVIPLWDEKGALLEASIQKRKTVKTNDNVGFPRFTVMGRDALKSKSGATGFRNPNADKLRAVAARLGWKNFTPKSLFNQRGDLFSCSLNGLQVYAEEFGFADEIRWVWDSDIFWDPVEKIEDVGEQKIYDLTVESTSCFIANDVIVHNTWTAASLGLHAWDVQKKRVLFATTEMKTERIAQRIIALKYRLNYTHFTKALLGEFIEKKLIEDLEELTHDDRFHLVGGDFDFNIENFEAAVDQTQPDIVLLDGAYLLRVAGATRTEKAANAFDDLKRICNRCNVPIAVTMQFNREVKANEAKSVRTESIALTDVASWNADMIYGLVQTEDMKAEKRMIFKSLKAREGFGVDFECNWDLDTMDFSQIGKLQKEGEGGGDADEYGVKSPSKYASSHGPSPSKYTKPDNLPF